MFQSFSNIIFTGRTEHNSTENQNTPTPTLLFTPSCGGTSVHRSHFDSGSKKTIIFASQSEILTVVESSIFYLIVLIIVLGFIAERLLERLNLKHWSPGLPDELKGLYDQEKYRKSQEYFLANHRFSVVTSVFGVVVFLFMLFSGGFALVDQWVREISAHPVVVSLLFFGILLFVFDLLHLPFEWYDTFVIEEKFEFNKTTPFIFVTDKLKSWLLGALIGGGILALVVWFYMLTGPSFWIWTWILVTAFSLFIAMFYSTLIVPLFNRQTPLEEGSLRRGIESFSKRVGFALENVFIIDGSKRSTKANAYFSGLGKKKRIVLFDTLINDLEENEIISVLAHEVGHYKKKHVWWGLLAGTAQTGISLFLLSLLLESPAISGALGVAEPGFHTGLLVFGLLYSPVSFVLGIFMNRLSRKHEYQADRFAGDTHEADSLISALKKLSVKNLSNLKPHPLYVFFHYSHPPLLQRIKALEEHKN